MIGVGVGVGVGSIKAICLCRDMQANYIIRCHVSSSINVSTSERVTFTYDMFKDLNYFVMSRLRTWR